MESLTRDLADSIKLVRKTGFTIAPEAGSQRLRNVINKGFTEQEIISTASMVFSSGWNLIKLYFMIGLPSETDEDISAIVSLSRKIAALDRKKQVNVSVSTFVPKPHTPFQLERQERDETIVKKQMFLKNKMGTRQLRIKWHNHNMSLLEGIFARGDRNLCNLLLTVHSMGAGFDAWTEFFNPRIWEEALIRTNTDINFYLRERSFDECLPWSHISCGISSSFLKSELEKSREEKTTTDCRTGDCTACGACSEKVKPVFTELPSCNLKDSIVKQTTDEPETTEKGCSIRIYFSKTGPARFISHLELSRCFARCLRMAKFPLKYSRGFHPHPKIVFHSALPVGMESSHEVLDMELTKGIDMEAYMATLNKHLPEGIEVLSWEEIILKDRPVTGTIEKYSVRIPENNLLSFPAFDDIKSCVDSFNRKDTFIISGKRKGSLFYTDLKEILRKAVFSRDNCLELEIDAHGRKKPAVVEIATALMGLDSGTGRLLRITKCS